eukprot:596430-Pleurochrysis_carterae.AAC.3
MENPAKPKVVGVRGDGWSKAEAPIRYGENQDLDGSKKSISFSWPWNQSRSVTLEAKKQLDLEAKEQSGGS